MTNRTKDVAVTEYREGWPLQQVHARFATIGEAEHWIAEREKADPNGVRGGCYGIDAPEYKLNPTPFVAYRFEVDDF